MLAALAKMLRIIFEPVSGWGWDDPYRFVLKTREQAKVLRVPQEIPLPWQVLSAPLVGGDRYS